MFGRRFGPIRSDQAGCCLAAGRVYGCGVYKVTIVWGGKAAVVEEGGRDNLTVFSSRFIAAICDTVIFSVKIQVDRVQGRGRRWAAGGGCWRR